MAQHFGHREAAEPRTGTLRLRLSEIEPFAFPLSLVPILLGASVADAQGVFNLDLLILTLFAALAVHGAAVLLGASSRAGVLGPHRTDGSSLRSTGRSRETLFLSVTSLLLSVGIGAFLVEVRGPTAVLALLAVPGLFFFAWGRSLGRPRCSVARPLVFLLFGPWLTLSAYYAQAQAVELVPLLYALPIGCLAAAGLGARSVGPASRPGSRATYALLNGAYGLVMAGVLSGVYVRWSSLALLTAPLAWTFARRAGPVDAPRDPATTAPAAVWLHLAFGLLLAVGVAA